MKRLLTLGMVLLTSTLFAAITIDPMSRTFAKDGGGGSVLTEGSGTWTASTSADWIKISPRTSGEAGETCVYVVSANFSADVRVGEILINDQVYTITQTGYSATLSPTTASYTTDGGSGTVKVTVDAGVSWSATPNVPWLHVTKATGLSSGDVAYTVDAHTEVTARSGSITIAGQIFAVTQTGTDVLLSPMWSYHKPDAAIIQVKVTALATTKWTVTPNDTWISVVDDGTGKGDANIIVAIGANPSAVQRTGTVTVGSKTLTIVQSGTDDIALDILPRQATANAIGAHANIAVLATPEMAWTADSKSSWITISDGKTGIGNGNIGYVASANPTLEPRTGTVRVTATLPYPDIEIERGLSCWRGTNYNGSVDVRLATAADATEPGRTEGVCFNVTEKGALHRIVGLNDDYGAVYVNTANVLVAHEGDHVQELIPVETNVAYELFVVHDGAKSVFYVREKDKGEDVKAFPAHYANAYNITAYSSSKVPSVGSLVHGTASTSAYYYWYRDLSELELNNLADVNLSADACKDDVYSDLYEHVSMEAIGLHESNCNNTNFVVSGAFARTTDRNSQYLGATKAAENKDVGIGIPPIYVWDEYDPHGSYYYRYAYPVNSPIRHLSTLNLWCKVDDFSGEAELIQWAWFLERMEYVRYITGSTSSAGTTYSYRLQERSVWSNFNFTVKMDLDKGLSVSNGLSYASGQLADGWHMITTTFSAADGNRMTLYVDGDEVGNFIVTDELMLGALLRPDTWQVCASAANGVAIDEISYFTNCLSSAQVARIYELEKPKCIVDHTVVQGTVEPSVSKERVEFAALGGSGEVDVTVAQRVGWTAAADVDWITFTSGTSYTGSRTVKFDVAGNPSVTTREGMLTLAGKTVKVVQAGLAATVEYDNTIFTEEGNLGYIDVYPEGDGTWDAVSDVSWITIVEGESDAGEGSVMFVVDPYTETTQSRTGTITVAGQKVYISQRGYELSIFPEVAQIGSNAGAGEFGVSAPIGAIWEAITTEPWITITGGNNGVGSGTLRYTVLDNDTGETRVGKIIVSGKEYTITQISSLLVTTETDGHGSVTGGGAYETGSEATLTATPKAGYVFSHWTGDMVGYSNPVKFTVDIGKTVKANFIPKDAAETIVNASALEQGFFTRDQMKDLALGQPTIEQDANGDFTLAIGLEECSSLTEKDWQAVKPTSGSVTITPEGHVRFKVRPDGSKTKFFKMVHRHENP